MCWHFIASVVRRGGVACHHVQHCQGDDDDDDAFHAAAADHLLPLPRFLLFLFI